MAATTPYDEFSPEAQKLVEGLIWLGYLETTFSFCGHSFTLHTLQGGDDLFIGVLTKEYQETLSQAKAWAYANVAMALRAVDGDVNFCPAIGPDPEAHARAKFNYVLKWYWPTIEYIYEQFALLVQKQNQAIRAVQDLSNRSLRPSTPSLDSLTAPGDSNESISTEDPA